MPKKTQPDFIPIGGEQPDFIPLSAGTAPVMPSDATSETPQREGFFHSLGSSLGLTDQASPMDGFKEHPLRTIAETLGGPAVSVAEGLYSGAKRSGGEMMNAGSDLMSGNKAGAAYHGIKAIPILGPTLDKATDQYANGDKTGEAGTILGGAAQLAPLILGGLDSVAPKRPLLGQIPSTARAGATFQKLNTQLANEPVKLSDTLQPLQRAAEVGARGSTLPKAVSDLLTRSQSPIDMTFPEARDYQSSLSDLSTSDKLAMNGRMSGSVAQVNKGFFNDIKAAADAQGLGDEFESAMNEYRNAKRLKSAGKTVAKAAGASAAAYAGYSGLHRLLGTITNQ